MMSPSSKFSETAKTLGILAHILRMVMEPKYYAFRFGDCTPLHHPLTFGEPGSLGALGELLAVSWLVQIVMSK